jgi:hypothetical protein
LRRYHIVDLAGDLVGRAATPRIDEDDVIGHPPFGDLAFKMRGD